MSKIIKVLKLKLIFNAQHEKIIQNHFLKIILLLFKFYIFSNEKNCDINYGQGTRDLKS